MEESAQQRSRMGVDDRLLPRLEHDRPLVLATGTVLREQTGPVLPTRRDMNAARRPHEKDVGAWTHTHDRAKGCVTRSGRCGRTRSVGSRRPWPARSRNRPRGRGRAGGCRRRIELGPGVAAGTIREVWCRMDVTPITERRTADAELAADGARLRPAASASSARDRVVTSYMVASSWREPPTLTRGRGCPGWDSNPHWMDFETIFSAGWNTRARPYRSRRI